MSQTGRQGETGHPDSYFAVVGGKRIGPLGAAELRRMAAEGELGPEDRVSPDGKRWYRARQFKNLTFRAPATPSDGGRNCEAPAESPCLNYEVQSAFEKNKTHRLTLDSQSMRVKGSELDAATIVFRNDDAAKHVILPEWSRWTKRTLVLIVVCTLLFPPTALLLLMLRDCTVKIRLPGKRSKFHVPREAIVALSKWLEKALVMQYLRRATLKSGISCVFGGLLFLGAAIIAVSNGTTRRIDLVQALPFLFATLVYVVVIAVGIVCLVRRDRFSLMLDSALCLFVGCLNLFGGGILALSLTSARGQERMELIAWLVLTLFLAAIQLIASGYIYWSMRSFDRRLEKCAMRDAFVEFAEQRNPSNKANAPDTTADRRPSQPNWGIRFAKPVAAVFVLAFTIIVIAYAARYAFDPSGESVSTRIRGEAENETVRNVQVSEGYLEAIGQVQLEGRHGNLIDVSDDGKTIAMDAGRMIHVWRTPAVAPVEIPVGYRHIKRGVLAPDGKVLTLWWSNEITRWNTDTGERINQWRPPAGENLLGVSSDIRYAAVRTSREIKIRDVVSDRDLATLDTDGSLYVSSDVMFSENGQVVQTKSGGNLSCWNTASGRRLLEIAGGSALGLSPDGRLLACRVAGENQLWDVRKRRQFATFSVPDGRFSSVQFATFSPDSAYLLVTARGNEAFVYDARKGTLIGSTRVTYGSRPTFLNTSPALVVHADDRALAWDPVADTTTSLGATGPRGYQVCRGASKLAVVTRDGRIQVWGSHTRFPWGSFLLRTLLVVLSVAAVVGGYFLLGTKRVQAWLRRIRERRWNVMIGAIGRKFIDRAIGLPRIVANHFLRGDTK